MTSRDRVVLIAGTGLIALMFAGGKVLPRAFDWHRTALDEVALRVRAVRGLQERLATASVLSDSLAYLEGAVSGLPDRLLRGGSTDDVRLDLIRRVSAASSDSAMMLDSLRIVASTPCGSSTSRQRPTRQASRPLSPAACGR